MKDYYSILEIPPHSTLAEIKQAYRRLAMIYHPDKTKNDPYTNVKYKEIREAYEILSNPIKKESYLQERWYNQSMGKKTMNEAATPVSILKLSLELEKYVSRLDVHRMNKEGLFNYINELLSFSTIEKLKQFNEIGINRQIITTILTVLKSLPLQMAKPLATLLVQLAGDDEAALQRIDIFLQHHKKNFLWNKYQILVIIFLTLLVCLLIYFTSK
ncbi:MAG TPA: J domain-containing protein [Chitinophagaceae bacterium]|jgi:curved DNA-binding protein CbpA|nr:J domain-containing protein [Chitinophagaceae bacterium]